MRAEINAYDPMLIREPFLYLVWTKGSRAGPRSCRCDTKAFVWTPTRDLLRFDQYCYDFGRLAGACLLVQAATTKVVNLSGVAKVRVREQDNERI
mgnify:CR=1 FL=1